MTFGRFSFRAQTLKTKERREKIKNPSVSVSMCGIPWQTYQLSRCIVETCRRANTLRRSTSVGNGNYTSCSIYVKMSQKLPTSLLTFKILSEALEEKKDNQQLFQIFPIHPRKLTWNLKIICLKRKIIFQSSIFGVPC